jgi:hypothetical protein
MALATTPRKQTFFTLSLEATPRPKGTEMTPTYLIHQVERSRTPAEQRTASMRLSELAAASTALCRSLTESLGFLRRAVQHSSAESVQLARG